jgi:phosphoglycerol transferase MdoB-like AlkP superfamily enzyme
LVVIILFSTPVKPLLPQVTRDHVLASALFFDRFILDFLIFLLTAALLINGGPIRRIIAYLWCLVFFAAYLVQLNAIYIGGEFVTFLAVDNIRHLSLLVNRNSVTATVIAVSLFALVVLLLEIRYRKRWRWPAMTLYCIVVFVVAFAMHQHRLWVPTNILELRDGYYASKDNRLEHRSPVESLYKVLFREKTGAIKPLTDDEIALAAQRYGISIKPRQQFPLVKPRIYSQPVPFGYSAAQDVQPNIIVFMVEGLSARTLNVYSDLIPGLTPNMADFASHGMVVNNYFNHTYATYRGLLGQFCSIYPTHGGLGGWHDRFEFVKRINYLCLSDLFNKAEYRTIFLDTHRRDHGYVDEMMAQINFSEVMTAENMVEKYVFQEPLRRDALSDHQLINGLIGRLESLDLDDDDRPFFLALYNLETHAFQKISKDGKPFDGGDSYVLDSIHNLDHAFGQFWDYFKQSDLYSNTVVILTSDHAHYPDRDFVSALRNDPLYQPYFIDRIPLVIYDPFKELPTEFDANYSSSIDFAPSMAHWFGLDNQENPFVGNSMFDNKKNANSVSIASADFEHYLISPQGIEMSSTDGQNSAELEFASYIVDTIRELEQHDRIWPADSP